MRSLKPVNMLLGILLLFAMGCVEDTVGILRPDDLTRPATPSSLTATASYTVINLSWNSVADTDLRGYNLYRSVSGDTTFSRIITALTTTAHTDSSGLLADTTYHYTVTAVDSTGNESFPSNIVSASLLSPVSHLLTMAANNTTWGQTDPPFGTSMHLAGSTVTIAATPAKGYRFVSWNGPVANVDAAETSVAINDDVTVTAIFEKIPPVTHDLSMQVNQNGWGTTTPASGTHKYADGTPVTITATPANGYRFVSWNGPVGNPTASETTVTINDDVTVTAIFEEIPPVTHNLSIAVNQSGWGATNPTQGIHTYQDGTILTITAVPANGYRFVKWNGPVSDANATKTTVTINADITVTAIFEEIPPDTYVLTMETNESGGGTTIPSAGTHIWTVDSEVTVTAIPAAGYRFAGWTGDVDDPNSATTTVTITGNLTVTAIFEKLNYQLTVDVYRENWGTVSPEPGMHAYPAFTVVPITAIPAEGYRFVRWTGNVEDPDAASTSITITQNETVTAIFEERPPDMVTLTMQVNGEWGTTIPTVGTHDYPEGTVVTIVATPAEGYRFSGWDGTVSNPGNATTTVTVTGPMTVTANFVKVTRTLTMAVVETGWGTTTPGVGQHSYDNGSSITVTAIPANGYRFVRWIGNVASTNSVSTTVTLTQNETITAVFEAIPPDMYVLTVQTTPEGKGASVPSAGTHIYASGTVVPLTATPIAGYRFNGWTGNITNPTDPVTTITITQHETITATFVPITHELTLAVNPAGQGTTSPAAGIHTYNEGSNIEIIAIPATGHRFVSWTGATVADSTSAATTITITTDGTVTANFEPIPHTLTMAINTPGTGSTTPAIGNHIYNEGTVVDITASPQAGYRFVNWTGAAVTNPDNATTTVTVTGDLTVTANFVRIYSLTTAVSPPGGGTTTPAIGTGSYDTGTVVPITATPEAGYRFVNWTGAVVADANSATTTITMDAAKSITANFVAVYDLTLAVNTPGAGTTTPAVGAHTYDTGTVVDITATPSAGYRFVNWTGDVTDLNNPNTTVTVDAAKTVTANFIAQYTLTMASSNIAQGTTTPLPGGHTYDNGTIVTISALPEAGFQFVNWTGDAVTDANNATTTVTVDADKSVTANFAIITYELTMVASPVGGGTLTPDVGTHSYDNGDVVNISAVPGAGYRFVNWSGAAVTDPNSSNTTITIDSAKTVTANFVAVFDLTMAVNNIDAGTTTPAIGAHTYDTGTVVNITATPNAGYRFVNWTGATVGDANSATTTVTVDAAKTVTANFVAIFDLTMAVNNVDAGTTTPAIGAHTYDNGTVVDITATPEAGYRFDSWTGDVNDPNSDTTTVTVDAAKTVTANFVAVFDLTMAVNNVDAGTTTPATGAHTYDTGTVVDISAVPAAGYRFVNWTGAVVGDANSATTTVTMDAAKTVTANFVAQYTLTIASSNDLEGSTTPLQGDHIYDDGTIVDITALPEAGFAFVNWTGDAVANENNDTTTITMDADKSVTANFIAAE